MTLNADAWASTVVRRDSLDHEYCYIQESSFLFGPERKSVSTAAPFFMGRHPVTKARFLEFVEATDYNYSPEWLEVMDLIAPFPNCPATPISWLDAKMYVRWLREITGEYYSLPSEIEWELAARGKYGALYPWGDSDPTPEHAVYSTPELPVFETAPVGSKSVGDASSGCQDMAGNVWEWCLEGFDEEDLLHVMRGGSSMEGVEACCATSRRYIFPANERVKFAGFRVTYLPGPMFGAYRVAMVGEDAPTTATVITPQENPRPRLMKPAERNAMRATESADDTVALP